MECQVAVCTCSVSMRNTGTDCQPIMQVAKKLIAVPIFDSTGARNSIDLTAAFAEAQILALINQADSSKRWYPLPEMRDIADTRDEPIRQEFDDRTSVHIAEGLRRFSGTIWGQEGSTTLKGKIDAMRCTAMGVYIVDRTGNLIGTLSADGEALYPIRLDSDSLSAQMAFSTNTTTQGLTVSFNFHPDEDDSCLRMITKDEMDGADLLLKKGLIDAHAVYDAPSITVNDFDVTLTTDYGTPKNPTTVKGMVAADFVSSVGGATSKVRRTNNTPADVSVTVAESTSTPGKYTVTFGVAQTSGDIIQLLLKKNGYDFTDLLTAQVTIP